MKFPVDRTVIVLDYSTFPLSQIGETLILDAKGGDVVNVSKGLWSVMVEAALEYSRIVMDLFTGERLLCVVVAGNKVIQLNTWEREDQCIGKVLDELTSIGVPNTSIPLVEGIKLAVDLLADGGATTNEKDNHNVPNRDRIICFVARPEPNEADDEPIKHFLVESGRGVEEEGETNQRFDLRTFTNRVIRAKNKELLIGTGFRQPIDHCELCVINTCVTTKFGHNNIPPYIPVSQLNKHFSYCAYTMPVAMLEECIARLVQLHYSLARVRLVDMAMKESQSATGTMHYEMVLMHTTENSFTETASPLLLQSKTDDQFLYSTPTERTQSELILSWESKFKLNNDLLPTKLMHKATPLDLASMPVSTAIKHILTGNKVCMASVGPDGSLAAKPSHALMSQGGLLYLCTLHSASQLDSTLPFASDEVSARYSDSPLRAEDLGSFMRSMQLTTTYRGGLGAPIYVVPPIDTSQTPLSHSRGIMKELGGYWAPDYLLRYMTSFIPFATDTVLFNKVYSEVQRHVRIPIVDVLLQETASITDLEEAAKQLQNLVQKRETQEGLLFPKAELASVLYTQMLEELKSFAASISTPPKGAHMLLGLLQHIQTEPSSTSGNNVKMEEGEHDAQEGIANTNALIEAVTSGEIVIGGPNLDLPNGDTMAVEAVKNMWTEFDRWRGMSEREKQSFLSNDLPQPIKEESRPQALIKYEPDEIPSILSMWRSERDSAIHQRAEFKGRQGNYLPYQGRVFTGRTSTPSTRGGRKRPFSGDNVEAPPSKYSINPMSPTHHDRIGHYRDKNRPRSRLDKESRERESREREKGRERGEVGLERDRDRDRDRPKYERMSKDRVPGYMREGYRDRVRRDRDTSNNNNNPMRDNVPFNKRWRLDEMEERAASPYMGSMTKKPRVGDRDRPPPGM